MVRGSWMQGEMSEDGKLYGHVCSGYMDGYTGSMKNNKKHGFGIETHRYGFTFVGEFKDGKRHGKMTYHNPDYGT